MLASPIGFHGFQHFPHSPVETDENGVADDAVADIERVQVGNVQNTLRILQVDAVAGIDDQSQGVGKTSAGAECGQLLAGGGTTGIAIGAGVQFNDRCAKPGRCLDLSGLGSDKKADFNAGILKFAD